jgi:uncharacterized membrane protein
MPETINKTNRHQAIGGVFTNRHDADAAVEAFHRLGIADANIHVVVSLNDNIREGKVLVTIHHVEDAAAVIEIFDANKADCNLDGSRNVRQDVAGLTMGAALGATAGGATGTVLTGPIGTVIGAATGAFVGASLGAAIGKVAEHLK